MIKKGQSPGSHAATLVLIILLLIIFYILFLAPEEREKLLEDDDSTSTIRRDRTTGLPEDVLLEKKGIIMSPFEQEEYKELPSVYLFEIINAKEIATFNPFIIKSGWFDKEFKNFTFAIDDLEKTENILLSMRINEGEGILTIKLNGHLLYEYTAGKGDITPISIDTQYLKDINNIEFLVDGVGAKFWKTNEYRIENVKLTADITDISKQKSKNIFTISESEYENIKSAKIHFTPLCKEGKTGILDILLNNREIFSAIPECNDHYVQPISTSLLEEGENYMTFQTTKGTYTIESIEISVAYKEEQGWRYSFYLDEEEYDRIISGEDDIELKIEFRENYEKRGAFRINDHGDEFDLDEDEDYYDYDISRWVDEGSNTLVIEPDTRLNIDYLRIELV
ncbi:MAG: hypothetical protein KAI26_02105 [Nanoarchaeota archaeon]|nr:hypothetical protein [Nanoarchaeota archaeon]